jgi:type IV pilus assembly protein PilM
LQVPLIYKEAPLFGFDVGNRSIKVVQIKQTGKKLRVLGYGHAAFPSDAIVEGIVSDPELIAKHVKPLFRQPQAGHVNSRRAIIAIPAAKVFIRSLKLPKMDKGDLEQAIRFEAEQYVPVPMADLYIDYEIIPKEQALLTQPTQPSGKSAQPPGAGEEHIDVLMVAAPRAIVDSYIKLFDYLGLEIDSIETTLAAITRAMIAVSNTNESSMVLDFGSRSADMAIYNQTVRLTGSISVGGDDMTDTLVKSLSISPDQANEIKYKFGVGTSGLQSKILEALEPKLQLIAAEIKKVTKYYKDRSENKEQVKNITLTGGSASMPGLIDYLYKATGLPFVIGDPWLRLDLGHLPKATKLEAPMYATAIGLALRGAHRD